MARKILPLAVPARLRGWAGAKHLLSPISTASRAPQSASESAIGFLGKKKLTSDRLLSVLDAINDAESALGVLRWACAQKPFRPTAAVCSRVIAKMGVFDDLVDRILDKDGERLDLGFGRLIDCFCGQQKLGDALKVMEVLNAASCKGPPILICNRLLGGLVEKGECQSVLFAYKEIVKAGIVPDVDTLNFLMNALCKINRYDAALRQYHRMSKKGCSPNSRTFEIMFGGLCLNNRAGEAREILREIFHSDDFQLDSSFYYSAIPLLCRFDWLEDAMTLYKKMSASEILPDSLLFGLLIRLCCNNLRMDEAVRLFSDMDRLGISSAVGMYVDIVYGYCKLGKLSEAEMFLDENPASDSLPYNSLLEEYCRRGYLSEAKRYVVILAKRGLCNTHSWNLLIRTLCENGLIHSAKEVIGRMVISSHNLDSDTYSSLVIGFCKMKRYDMVMELFAEVSARGYCLNSCAFSELIYSLCVTNKMGEAVEVFNYLSSKGCSLNVSCLNLLIEKICLIGKISLAICLRSLASCSGTLSCPTTYATIMNALLPHNETRSILVLFSQMLVEGCDLDLNVYRALIHAFCSENRISCASVLFNQMVVNDFLPDSETLHAFLSCAASNSQLHLVASSLHKIMSEEGAFSHGLYNFVVNGLCIEGHKDQAWQFLDKMLELGLLPDPATHAMFFGSTSGKGRKIAGKEVGTCDKVAEILACGLGEI